MSLIVKDHLIKMICPPIDAQLGASFVDEFISSERRYIQRDWEPSQLDGGQFAEVSAQIFYAADTGKVNRNKDLQSCLSYLENDQVSHALLPRSDALHVARVLRTIYKFRSQRGAVHLSPNYTPNHRTQSS